MFLDVGSNQGYLIIANWGTFNRDVGMGLI